MKGMMRMKKSMDELKDCAPIVQKTMMQCFFVADEGVRKNMGASENRPGNPYLLTDEVTGNIADDIGACYK